MRSADCPRPTAPIGSMRWRSAARICRSRNSTPCGSCYGDGKLAVPIYACTGRHVLQILERDGHRQELESSGVIIVADTCVVVTPILPEKPGAILMTNSGKFSHYAPGEHRLFGAVWVDGRLRRERRQRRPVLRSARREPLHAEVLLPGPRDGGDRHWR